MEKCLEREKKDIKAQEPEDMVSLLFRAGVNYVIIAGLIEE
jgi:hypothetical protein